MQPATKNEVCKEGWKLERKEKKKREVPFTECSSVLLYNVNEQKDNMSLLYIIWWDFVVV